MSEFVSLSGQNIPQRKDELRKFINLMKKEKCTSYLEVGARYGDSFYNIVKAMPQGSTAIAIDLPDSRWGRSDSQAHLQNAICKLNEEGYKTTAIFADSQNPATKEQLLKLMGPLKFDMVMIDADHRFEGMTLDWINYGPFGRLVAFHDIDGHDQWERSTGFRVECPLVWAAIKRNYRYIEIVGKHRGMGIGVVWR